MKPKILIFRKSLWILFPILALLAGCGGGSGDGNTGTNRSDTAVISGTATKGPVLGATVTAFSINPDGTKGGQIGSGQTDGQGSFSITVENHSGPVMLQMMGGSYMDEATGSQMSMGSNDLMTCVMPSMSGGAVSGVQITPLTSMAQSRAQYMSGGMTQTNITRANQAMGQHFAVSDILMTRPMDPTISGSMTAATEHMRNYGMSIAAMSQYAKNIGMPNSSGMVTDMMNDVSDGNMDGVMVNAGSGMGGGMMDGQQIVMGGGMMASTMMPADAGTKGLADAMAQFINSPMNKSGLTMQDMQDLINKLSTSNGQIQ